MLTALKKTIGVVILIAVLFGVVGPGIVFAQEREVGGVALTDDDIKAAINSPTPNLANTTAYIFYTVIVVLKGMSDSDLSAVQEAVSPPAEESMIPRSLNSALAQGGAIGGLSYLTVQLIGNPPASFGYYASDLAHRSRFGAQPAYAQGLGFGALSPILGTWNAFKNIAYYILTVMFFVTGFLILIRHKVSGNVAVTVQNALPRLVITLIVITFSYAIAGLIVDLMYLAIYFIINLFASQIFVENAHFEGSLGIGSQINLRQLALDTNIFQFTIRYIFGSDAAAWNVANSVAGIISSALRSTALDKVLQYDVVSGLFDFIVGAIFYVVLAVAMFIAMFRVFFALIMSYAGFVINVVLSPLILLEGAIPGRSPWSKWLKNLLAGLLPFVVIIFMIFMSYALTGVNTRPGIGYTADGPDVSGLRLPLIGGQGLPADAFMGILAMGFILLMPEAVKMAKEAVGAKGGPFDQYKDKLTGALKEGWKGSGSMPGAKSMISNVGGGAAVGGVVGGLAAARSAEARGYSGGRRTLETIRGAALGGAGGVALTTVGAPIYRRGEVVFKKAKKYQETIDKTALSFEEAARLRRGERGAAEKGQAATAGSTTPTPQTGGSTGGTPTTGA